jgi:hypothetical protein
MPTTEKFPSKLKFRGHKYVVVNKTRGFSEGRQPQSEDSDRSSCSMAVIIEPLKLAK